MPSLDTAYQARFEDPEDIEQGRDNVLRCPVYLNGVLAVPSAGTFTLRKPGGDDVVAAQAVTVTNGIALYTVTTATLSTLTRAEGYAIEWALTMPDGVVHTFRTDAALVRRRIYPTITDRDLYRVHSTLDPQHPAAVTTENSYQDKIEEAWRQFCAACRRKGTRPQFMSSPPDHRDCLLNLTLALIFEDLGITVRDAGAGYREMAAMYRDRYKASFDELQVQLDADENGMPDQGGARQSVVRTLWLGSNRRGGFIR